MVLSAAAATVLAGGISAAGGLGSSLIGSSSGSSAISKEDQMEMMKYQNDLNKELMGIQFNYNRWFAQNSYQNAVGDLRKAGLNPLLVSPNGNSGSVGLGSTGLLDPSSTVSSAASMKLAKAQALQGFANTVSNVMLNRANSIKAIEEAKTEANKRDVMEADRGLKMLEQAELSIKNQYLPEQIKADVYNKITVAKANLISAEISKAIAPSIISSNYSSAVSAQAAMKNAEANYINATQGNQWKTGVDIIKSLDAQYGGKLKKLGLYK